MDIKGKIRQLFPPRELRNIRRKKRYAEKFRKRPLEVQEMIELRNAPQPSSYSEPVPTIWTTQVPVPMISLGHPGRENRMCITPGEIIRWTEEDAFGRITEKEMQQSGSLYDVLIILTEHLLDDISVACAYIDNFSDDGSNLGNFLHFDADFYNAFTDYQAEQPCGSDYKMLLEIGLGNVNDWLYTLERMKGVVTLSREYCKALAHVKSTTQKLLSRHRDLNYFDRELVNTQMDRIDRFTHDYATFHEVFIEQFLLETLDVTNDLLTKQP